DFGSLPRGGAAAPRKPALSDAPALIRHVHRRVARERIATPRPHARAQSPRAADLFADSSNKPVSFLPTQRVSSGAGIFRLGRASPARRRRSGGARRRAPWSLPPCGNSNRSPPLPARRQSGGPVGGGSADAAPGDGGRGVRRRGASARPMTLNAG